MLVVFFEIERTSKERIRVCSVAVLLVALGALSPSSATANFAYLLVLSLYGWVLPESRLPSLNMVIEPLDYNEENACKDIVGF